MNAYRISIYDEGALRVAQSYEAILLLQPAEQQTQSDTNHRTNHCNHSSLEEEDTRNLLVIGTQIPQCHHIILLVDDEHRERTDDVETCHYEDKGQEDVSHQLLYRHDLESIFLLLKSIQHLIFGAGNLLHLSLYCLQVTTLLQADLQIREHTLLTEEIARKGNGGDDIILVVFRLLDSEEHTRRIQRINHEAGIRIHHIQLSLLLRSINLHKTIPFCPDTQGLCQTDTHGSILQIGSMERETAITIKDVVDMR